MKTPSKQPKDLLASHVASCSSAADKVMDACGDDVERAAQLMLSAIRSGHKILVCGNGGSAISAQRLASELVGRRNWDSPESETKPLAAYSLSSNAASMTAIGNNYGFDRIFSRQVEALGSKGDVLIAITTSGRSTNIIHAAQTARQKEMSVIGLTGETGGGLTPHCDVCIRVPSKEVYSVQIAHFAVESTLIKFLAANL